VEALRVVRGWGSHNFHTFGSQMAARLSALRAGHFLPPGRLLVLISVRGWVDYRAIVRLEGLGKLKKSTSSGTRIGYLPACASTNYATACPQHLPVGTVKYYESTQDTLCLWLDLNSHLPNTGLDCYHYISLLDFPIKIQFSRLQLSHILSK
jgi:hypothetical protein